MHRYNKTMLSLESFGDPQLIALPGGVVVTHDGAVVGAIGVGGLPSGLDDEAIARAGCRP
jgi:glc operon protein GlcG